MQWLVASNRLLLYQFWYTRVFSFTTRLNPFIIETLFSNYPILTEVGRVYMAQTAAGAGSAQREHESDSGDEDDYFEKMMDSVRARNEPELTDEQEAAVIAAMKDLMEESGNSQTSRAAGKHRAEGVDIYAPAINHDRAAVCHQHEIADQADSIKTPAVLGQKAGKDLQDDSGDDGDDDGDDDYWEMLANQASGAATINIAAQTSCAMSAAADGDDDDYFAMLAAKAPEAEDSAVKPEDHPVWQMLAQQLGADEPHLAAATKPSERE